MKYQVSLNGKIYEVEVEQGKAMLIDEYNAVAPSVTAAAPIQVQVASTAPTVAAAPAPASSGNGNVVKSPLPGSVIAVKVSTGDTVKKGALLCLVEAMKMENEITAPSDGKVGAIFVTKGANISTGAPILELL